MRPFEGMPALHMGSKTNLSYKYGIWGLLERKDSQTRPPALRAPGQKDAISNCWGVRTTHCYHLLDRAGHLTLRTWPSACRLAAAPPANSQPQP